jgi:ribosomal protein S6
MLAQKILLCKSFLRVYFTTMREKEVEVYFDWAVQRMGGRTWKFTSPGRKGVADRIACLPDGQTWFVELKTKGGRLSELQKLFQTEMALLRQNYTCLWTKEQVDGFITTVSRDSR